MRLNSAEIKGFASFKDHVKVNIPSGITGVAGSIEGIEGKSNGSGKTKLLMSLPFALFGEGTFDRMEEVWNDKLSPSDDAFVKWDIDLMGNNYIIERGRKKKASYLDVFENGKRVKEGNTESQEFIHSLLGMDSKMFLSSAFTAQKDLAAFIETDPAVRKSYMDVVTDLGLWRSASKRSSTIYKDSKALFDVLLGEIKVLDKTISDNETIIRSLTCELQNIAVVKQKRDEKSAEISKIQNIKNIRSTLSEYESLKKKAIQEIANLNIKKTSTEDSLKEAASSISKLEEEFSIFISFDIDVATADIEMATRQLSSLSENVTQLNEQMKTNIIEIAYNDADLKHLEEEKVNLVEGICNSCKQPVSKDHVEKHYNEINAKKEILLEDKAVLEKTKDSIQGELDALFSESNAMQNIIKDENDRITKYTELKQRMETAEDSYKKTNENLVLDLKNINTQLLSTQNSMVEYDNKINELQQQISENAHIDINLLSQELDALTRTLEDLTIKQGRLLKFEEDAESHKIVLSNKKNKLKNIQENLYYLEVLGEAFKDIPAELFKESVIDVENYANEIIRSIYHKFKIKIYEDEAKKNRPLMIAFEVDGKYRNYKLLSGGQQSICAIGLRMGFNRILSQRSRISLNFLILDEIFGSLDKFNREEVLRMLNGLTKFFPQILVITHTEEDHIFPNLIKVRMDNMGASSII